MLTKHSNTLSFLSFHTIAAARGDGLRPEFVDLFKRLAAGADSTLSESSSPVLEPSDRGDDDAHVGGEAVRAGAPRYDQR